MREDWRSPSYRQKISKKFDDSIKYYKMTTSHTAGEMEDHIFQKSRTQEEYVGYVARLVLYIREKGSCPQAADSENSPNLHGKFMSFDDFQNRDWSSQRESITARIEQIIDEDFVPSVFKNWQEREEFLDFAVSLILNTCDLSMYNTVKKELSTKNLGFCFNPFEGESPEE